MDSKKSAGEKAADLVRDNMVVGLGTGSTAYWAIKKIGEKVKEGLKIRTVASSIASESLAKELNIPLVGFAEINGIDLTIDGADEIDSKHNLIKGGGGALLREKILARNSQRVIIVVDEKKLVDKLGKFLLPVEIVPFASNLTLNNLRSLHCLPKFRMAANGQNFITDNGNYIIDCDFGEISNVDELNSVIHLIPGVVETGLFSHNMVNSVIVGYKDGTVKEF